MTPRTTLPVALVLALVVLTPSALALPMLGDGVRRAGSAEPAPVASAITTARTLAPVQLPDPFAAAARAADATETASLAPLSAVAALPSVPAVLPLVSVPAEPTLPPAVAAPPTPRTPAPPAKVESANEVHVAVSAPPTSAAALGTMALAATAAAALGWAVGGPSMLVAWAKRVLAVAGFHRVARGAALDHDARDRLYQRILASPGLALHELVEGEPTGRSSVFHHLRVLEREGLVASVRQGRRRYYFANGHRATAATLAVLALDTTRAFARSVAAEPGLDQTALCARLGVTPSRAHWHADRLEAAGIVAKVREGRRVRYFPGTAWTDAEPFVARR